MPAMHRGPFLDPRIASPNKVGLFVRLEGRTDVTLTEMNWANGYVQETRYLRSLTPLTNERPTRGWSRGKHTVKVMLKNWAIPMCFACGDAQKGMIDALLDSVGC